MPYRITFPVKGMRDPAYAREVLLLLLGALAAVDRSFLETHRAPSLAAAPVFLTSVRSKLTPPGSEEWVDVPCALPHLAEDGSPAGGRVNPCSAVAWRVAELPGSGPHLIESSQGWRPAVVLANGAVEDVAPGPFRPWLADMRVTFVLDLFNGKVKQELSHAALRVLLRTLTLIDVLYLRTHPDTPPLHLSGVVYKEEPPGAEDWRDIPTILSRGTADCDDLAPWLAAERIVQGVPAAADFEMQTLSGGRTLYHIITKSSRYGREDPSYDLGMR